MEYRLEVVVLPVPDVDKAKDFHRGWAGGWTPTSTASPATGSCS